MHIGRIDLFTDSGMLAHSRWCCLHKFEYSNRWASQDVVKWVSDGTEKVVNVE